MKKNILNLNFYIFKNKIFLNKIIFEKIINLNIFLNINFYYLNLKKTLNYFNPFYGTKIITLLDKIKHNFLKKSKKILKKKKYKVPYRELSFIFKLSIEKIRIKK